MSKTRQIEIINKRLEKRNIPSDLIDTFSLVDSEIDLEDNWDSILEEIGNYNTPQKEIINNLKGDKFNIEQKEAEERHENFFKDFEQFDETFINNLLNKPKIIGIIADVNSGKSMLIYNLLQILEKYKVNIVTYGLRANIQCKRIHSIEELEGLRDSVIFLDEYFSLFDLDDRKKARLIEKTLRLINHNNNILFLAGTPDNFRKFIASKLDVIIFKKCSMGDFVNGSRVKNVCLSYKGYELGTSVLNINIDKALLFNQKDGSYNKYKVEYLPKYDTKTNNVPILIPKNVPKKMCEKKVPKNVPIPNNFKTKLPMGVG